MLIKCHVVWDLKRGVLVQYRTFNGSRLNLQYNIFEMIWLTCPGDLFVFLMCSYISRGIIIVIIVIFTCWWLQWRFPRPVESSASLPKEKAFSIAAVLPVPCYNLPIAGLQGEEWIPFSKNEHSAQHVAQQLTLLEQVLARTATVAVAFLPGTSRGRRACWFASVWPPSRTLKSVRAFFLIQEVFQGCHPVHFLKSRIKGIGDKVSPQSKWVSFSRYALLWIIYFAIVKGNWQQNTEQPIFKVVFWVKL